MNNGPNILQNDRSNPQQGHSDQQKKIKHEQTQEKTNKHHNNDPHSNVPNAILDNREHKYHQNHQPGAK